MQVLRECGLEDLRRRAESVPSLLIGAITFGFAYPAHVTARKPAPAGGQADGAFDNDVKRLPGGTSKQNARWLTGAFETAPSSWDLVRLSATVRGIATAGRPGGLRDWEDSACQPPSRPLHLTMPIEARG